MTKLTLTVLAIIVLAAPVRGQIAGTIGIYADGGGQTCNVNDVGQSTIVTLYVIHTGASNVTASQFKVAPVAGANMTWLSDISSYTISGSSQSGIGITYGSCTSTPGEILRINYFGQGLSSTCSGYDVVASPTAQVGTSPGLVVLDCVSTEMPATGSNVVVNPNLGCECSTPTGIGDTPRVTASLGQNYPNPFNPTTTIAFSLEEPAEVSLQVFDVRGRRVKDLASGFLGAGDHRSEWDGRDDSGRQVATGVYFYRLRAGGFTEARQMVLLK